VGNGVLLPTIAIGRKCKMSWDDYDDDFLDPNDSMYQSVVLSE
jgi:hypothetical protein